MVSRVWIINSVLAIALVICLMNIWDVWHTSTQVFPEKRSAVNDKKAIQIKKSPESKVLSASAYQSVVDKNLFSPDRAEAPPESGVAEPEIQDVRISGEKVVLYGVIMIDDYKKALINNPGDRKTDSKNRWVSEGEQIGNLTVRQIQEDEILLVDGSNSYRVLLYDPDKASKISGKSGGQSKEDAQPKVISTGAKPVAVKKRIPKRTEKVTISADGKYEIIDTPLGKIKRKRK
ncbi:MAG: hypothetical protein HF978_05165 [Desulfobacteraceae bacterium]|nr:hypothetical protein [Desulfobacteraceae bacterium]MBC2754921.1 hypothetical protein [Desulfobacteraceae bacterium]